MNPSLLLGIIIGMGAVLFCFGIFLALPARRVSKANKNFNEKSLEELTERNAIGHEQLAALWKIAGYLAPKDTRAADRKDGRIYLMVRRDTPDHDAYIKARFPGGYCKSDTFEFAGHRWKYGHSSFDDLGEFDLLWRPTNPTIPTNPELDEDTFTAWAEIDNPET